MNIGKIGKFESAARLNELKPAETLIRAGLAPDMTVCDIGAGTGVFTFPAAEITGNTVYALEISEEMMEILESRKKEKGVENLVIQKVNGARLPLADHSCDLAIMVTVLHEIPNPEGMLEEIRRILRHDGKCMIIEFHKKETPMGPPPGHRIAMEKVEELGNGIGFVSVDMFSLGENFYAIVFARQEK